MYIISCTFFPVYTEICMYLVNVSDVAKATGVFTWDFIVMFECMARDIERPTLAMHNQDSVWNLAKTAIGMSVNKGFGNFCCFYQALHYKQLHKSRSRRPSVCQQVTFFPHCLFLIVPVSSLYWLAWFHLTPNTAFSPPSMFNLDPPNSLKWSFFVSIKKQDLNMNWTRLSLQMSLTESVLTNCATYYSKTAIWT